MPPKKQPSKKPTIIKRQAPPTELGRNGRQFHAHRSVNSFTAPPPVFTTEKDPRGKPDNTWFNLPPPTGKPPFRLDLASILTDAAIASITKAQRLVFHSVGDTGGVNTTTYQQQVATYMELDFNASNPAGGNPSFFYHLGDVVYYDGEVVNYYPEFYEPYVHYPAPIFAIPGNHDGDVDPNDQFNKPTDSLKGFVRNFCSPTAAHLPEAKEAPRNTMTQPNVYWTLNTPLATVIGMYSNVPEGGQIKPDQINWLNGELAAAPKDRALILAVHHPLYSAYGAEPGSQHIKGVIEAAAKTTSRTPDLILTGHVHNYQRFTGYLNGQAVTSIVAGAGGYNQKLHVLDRTQFTPTGCPYKFADGPEQLEKFNDFQHGYLLLDVRPDKILGSYIAVNDPGAGPAVPTQPAKPYDTFQINLNL